MLTFITFKSNQLKNLIEGVMDGDKINKGNVNPQQ